ncbi:TIGR03915 family putative DNA repair protein [Leeuwenhoekiella sp. NPDC079379]|uniref:TIGR03915 family putative DNA repair protein n=1 Tax=Leeuwenhoekiella sp. NPDC079379 TaxID=3364122 RepID=UPI0037C719EE
MQKHKLVYDGSFEGMLTAIFQVYEERLSEVIIVDTTHFEPDFFSETVEIYTDETKASRVWEGLRQFKSFQQLVYWSFLSEQEGRERYILAAIQYVLKTKNENDFGHPAVLMLAQLTKKVGREKHRMEAFVRFKRTADDLYASIISPDFNVLPLIARHFKNRYADQQFLIFDSKRDFGLFYDLNKIEFVSFDFKSKEEFKEAMHEEENQYDLLWQNYFTSTTIRSRINLKLHTQHVPKRYWKYLNEKNPL